MYLGEDTDTLELEIERLTRELQEKQNALDRIRTTCNHMWSDATLCSDTSGKRVGNLWRRSCLRCGKVQTTTSSRQNVTEVPVF